MDNRSFYRFSIVLIHYPARKWAAVIEWIVSIFDIDIGKAPKKQIKQRKRIDDDKNPMGIEHLIFRIVRTIGQRYPADLKKRDQDPFYRKDRALDEFRKNHPGELFDFQESR